MSQDMLQKPSALGVEIPDQHRKCIDDGYEAFAKERFQAMKAFARAFGQAQAATPEKEEGRQWWNDSTYYRRMCSYNRLAVAAFILFWTDVRKKAASDNDQTEATTEASSESTTETTEERLRIQSAAFRRTI